MFDPNFVIYCNRGKKIILQYHTWNHEKHTKILMMFPHIQKALSFSVFTQSHSTTCINCSWLEKFNFGFWIKKKYFLSPSLMKSKRMITIQSIYFKINLSFIFHCSFSRIILSHMKFSTRSKIIVYSILFIFCTLSTGASRITKNVYHEKLTQATNLNMQKFHLHMLP